MPRFLACRTDPYEELYWWITCFYYNQIMWSYRHSSWMSWTIQMSTIQECNERLPWFKIWLFIYNMNNMSFNISWNPWIIYRLPSEQFIKFMNYLVLKIIHKMHELSGPDNNSYNSWIQVALKTIHKMHELFGPDNNSYNSWIQVALKTIHKVHELSRPDNNSYNSWIQVALKTIHTIHELSE